MSKRAPLTDANGEVRALTAEDMAQFRPASQALPVDLQAMAGSLSDGNAVVRVRVAAR